MKTRIVRASRPALALAAVMLTAAACGGSSEASGSSSASSGLQEDADIASLVPEAVAEEGVLTVGTAVYPPAVIVEDQGSDPTGWDIATIADAAALMGLDVEYNVTQWDGLITGLEANRFDVALGEMAILPERTELVTFVHNHDSGVAFIVKGDSDLSVIDSVDDVCGLRVAVLLGSSEQKSVQDYAAECETKGLDPLTVDTFKDQATANLAVTEGRVDASLSSASQAVYVVEQTGDALKVVNNDFAPLVPTGVALAKTDYSDEMAVALQAAIQKLIDDGRLQEILDEYNGGLGGIETAKIVPEPAA